MSNNQISYLALLPLLSLAACGGGGSGVASTPTPLPTPTPTPTPSVTINLTMDDLVGNENFLAVPRGLTTTASRSTGLTGTAAPSLGKNFSVFYDAAASSYTISRADGTQTFGPANRDTQISSTSIDAYTVKTGNTTRTLALFKPGASNPKIALTYMTYGALQLMADNNTQIAVTSEFFTIGLVPFSDKMRRTGSAEYSGIVDGLWVSGGDMRALTGTGRIFADFDAGKSGLDLELSGTSVLGNGSHAFGTVIGSGYINAQYGEFAGTLSGQASYSGAYYGRFYGPDAAEAGAVFNLTDGAGGAVAGVIVGKQR